MAEYQTTTRDGRTVFKHRMIWEEHHGKIPQGFVVHHKNGNKHDNRIENLELLSCHEHMKLHWERKRQC